MNTKPSATIIKESGFFANNNKLPLLLYKQAFDPASGDLPATMEATFKNHDWGNNWRNGLYAFHHYHSQAHEFIGVYGGGASIQFGGPEGPVVKVKQGDAVVIPAGVSHKRVTSTGGFAVVGAYPTGQSPDMMMGEETDRPQADQNIAKVALPKQDPLLGKNGPLTKLWRPAKG